MNYKIRNYRKDIQIFRALAILSVLIYHLFPISFENLKIGVDIFFVISGFVITKSILNFDKFGINEFQDFIRKRIKRIFPLSIISSLIIWVAFTILSPGFFSERDTFSSIFGIQNLLLGRVGRPYGGLNLNLNPYTHYWSLGVEAQFYLLYPLILFTLYWLITKKSKKKELIYNSKKLYENTRFYNNLKNLLLFFCIISFISYAFNYNPTDAWSFFNPFLRFWEILIGCLSYLYSLKVDPYKIKDLSIKQKNKVFILVIFITFFILYSLFGSSQIHSTLLLLTLIFFGKYINDPLDKIHFPFRNILFYPLRILSYIGEISFSIYIWHWPILLSFNIIFGGISNSIYLFSYFLIVFLISVISKNLIENNCSLYLSNSNINKESIIFIFSLFSMFLTTIGINEARKTLANKFRPYKSETTPSTFNKKKVDIGGISCAWGYKDSFTDSSDYQKLFNCLNTQKSLQNASRNIFLIGDSHSSSIAPAVYKYSLEKKYNFLKVAHVYCPFRLKYSMNWKVANPVKDFSCSNFNKAVFDYLTEYAKDGDLIFLSSRDIFYFSETLPLSKKNKKNYDDGFIKYFDKSLKVIGNKRLIKESVNDIEKLSNKFEDKDVKIIVILQGHENKNPLHYCDHIFSNNISDCLTDYKDIKRKKDYSLSIKSLSATNDKISNFELIKYTCPDKKFCRHMINDKYIFRDEDHITSYFAEEYIYDEFRSFINKLTKSSN